MELWYKTKCVIIKRWNWEKIMNKVFLTFHEKTGFFNISIYGRWRYTCVCFYFIIWSMYLRIVFFVIVGNQTSRCTLRSKTIFGNWKLFKNDKKNFLFYHKGSFRPRDIEIFVLTFWSCRKTAGSERQRQYQNLWPPTWEINICNTHIAQLSQEWRQSDN